MNVRLILSCEHGGNRVPAAYRPLFDTPRGAPALASHRGLDHGALELARSLAARLRAPLYAATVTRLLVDLNRSQGHPRLLSEFSRPLTGPQRSRLIARYYLPYRERVRQAVAQAVERGERVCHLSVHSFAPLIDGRARNADFGLLYDPSRRGERRLCAVWARKLRESGAAKLRVRRNYPYRGTADGFATQLRTLFGPREYLGIELEVNAALLRRAPRAAAALLSSTLAATLAEPGAECGGKRARERYKGLI